MRTQLCAWGGIDDMIYRHRMISRELSQVEQIALWDRRARMSDMYSPRPDAQLVQRLGDMEAKLRQALDIGCGCGRHLLHLAQLGWRVTGIDWSTEALSQASRVMAEAGEVGSLVKGDWRRLPFPGGYFSLVIATNALQHGHWADFKRSMLEIKRVLKVGGTAIISVPGRSNMPPAIWGNWIEDGTVILDRTAEEGLPHHFFSEVELGRVTGAFPRGATADLVTEPWPAGFTPYGSEQRNEWYWLTLRG